MATLMIGANVALTGTGDRNVAGNTGVVGHPVVDAAKAEQRSFEVRSVELELELAELAMEFDFLNLCHQYCLR